MTDEPNYDLTVPAWQTASYVGVKAFLGSIPVAGVGLSEAFAEILASPSQRRRDEVLTLLADGFGRMGIDVEELRQRVEHTAELYDTIAYAIPQSVRTSSPTKREALRNAILNTAAGHGVSETKRHIFLVFVEELSPTHLQLLALLTNPRQWFARHRLQLGRLDAVGPYIRVVKHGLPELYDQQQLLFFCYNQLADRTLIDNRGLMESVGSYKLLEGNGTDLGRELLAFISEPPELQESGETPEPQA